MATMIVTVVLKDDDFREQTFEGKVIVTGDWARSFDEPKKLSNAIAEAFEKFAEGKPATAFKEYDGDYALGDEDAWVAANKIQGKGEER